VVRKLLERKDPLIFVLWGRDAREKCRLFLEKSTNTHFFLESSHPSPYSAHSGFFGSRPFSKINELLKKQGKTPINWALKNG
jgi:uracil-DNA glycosylase